MSKRLSTWLFLACALVGAAAASVFLYGVYEERRDRERLEWIRNRLEVSDEPLTVAEIESLAEESRRIVARRPQLKRH
jgi:hypothetical protein